MACTGVILEKTYFMYWNIFLKKIYFECLCRILIHILILTMCYNTLWCSGAVLGMTVPVIVCDDGDGSIPILQYIRRTTCSDLKL